MEAEKGKVYAQIIDGKCHWKFTANELPEWNDDAFLAVDITGQDVEIGDIYDETTKSFVKPMDTDEEIIAKTRDKRMFAYRNEADPIFFKVQRGEDGLTFKDWLDKVAEIRARYPYPPEVTIHDKEQKNIGSKNQ